MTERGFDEAVRRYREVRGTSPRDQLERTPAAQAAFEEQMSMFDEPLICGVESPEICESCQ